MASDLRPSTPSSRRAKGGAPLKANVGPLLNMKIKEIYSKAVLSSSQVYDYVINPYVGCQHACTYCYARFMKRFSGHKESWGDFVDVKIHAPDLLIAEIRKKKKGKVWIS